MNPITPASHNPAAPGDAAPATSVAAAADRAPVVLNSEELLRGQANVAIAHNGALYRLQSTRQGKLILTK